MCGYSSPSSLSLYWSEFVLPFWLLSAFGRTVTSVGPSGSARGWSKSFCSFFSYNLRVEAEWRQGRYKKKKKRKEIEDI